MHFRLIAVLLLVTAWVVTRGDPDPQCQDAALTCLQNMMSFSGAAESAKFLLFMTEKQFHHFCRTYNEADECLQSLSCRDEVATELQGFNNALTFMCQDNPEGFPDYARCLTYSVVQEEMQACCQKAAEKPRDTRDSACRVHNDYLQCGYRTLRRHCVKNEAQWFEQLYVKLSDPMMQLISCETDRPSEKDSHTKNNSRSSRGGVKDVILQFLGLVTMCLALLIFLIFAICLYRNRKQDGGSKPKPSPKPDVAFSC